MGDVNRFLEQVNLRLLELEERQRGRGYRVPSPHLLYFVIGAPRSGTTLLTQALAHCCNFGFITNIAARFWMCPAIGLKLSREIAGDGEVGFVSNRGRTIFPGDIHEFGRFWMAHLGLESSADVERPITGMSLGMVYNALRAILDHFDKPVVMKGIYPAYFREIFDKMDLDVRWVYIDRDPLDCCVSIQKQRLKSKGHWFGWHLPPELRMEVDGVMEHEVAMQVAYFRHKYAKMADITVTLEDLCDFPRQTLREIVGENDPIKIDWADLFLEFKQYDHDLRERWRGIYQHYDDRFREEFDE